MAYRSRKNRGFHKLALVLAGLMAVLAFHHASSRGAAHDSLIKVVEIASGTGMDIRPALARDRHSGEEFSEMIRRLRPYAAINGTFYDKQMKPLGDIVIDGKLVNHGAYRHALAITKSGKTVLISRKNGKFGWSKYRAGIAAGPRLVHKGKIALDPVADGFSKRSKSISAWRSGAGITKKGNLLLVTAKKSLTFAEFAQVMLDLGSVEALNLDGGGACGLYYRGRTLAFPTLRMTNMLVVYKK